MAPAGNFEIIIWSANFSRTNGSRQENIEDLAMLSTSLFRYTIVWMPGPRIALMLSRAIAKTTQSVAAWTVAFLGWDVEIRAASPKYCPSVSCPTSCPLHITRTTPSLTMKKEEAKSPWMTIFVPGLYLCTIKPLATQSFCLGVKYSKNLTLSINSRFWTDCFWQISETTFLNVRRSILHNMQS